MEIMPQYPVTGRFQQLGERDLGSIGQDDAAGVLLRFSVRPPGANFEGFAQRLPIIRRTAALEPGEPVPAPGARYEVVFAWPNERPVQRRQRGRIAPF